MMAGSETGAMASREVYSSNLQKAPLPSQPVIQNMRLAYSSEGGGAIYKPVAASSPPYHSGGGGGGGGGGSVDGVGGGSGGGGGGSGGVPLKKKRGRPRKYGPDGSMSLAIVPASPAMANSPPPIGFSPPPSQPKSPALATTPGSDLAKKARGRPRGSSKKQQLEALGPAGFGFMPHIITVKAGEDVSSKIMSFSQNGPRAICILTANGTISNVTLRQAATSGGTVTHEGRFEIVTLSGSFTLSESGGPRSRTGGLSVSLSGADGRFIGGCVAGMLLAAAPVQVVVGSFFAEGRSKDVKRANHHHMEPLSGPPKLPQPSGIPIGPSSPSHGTGSESSGEPASPIHHSAGPCNNNNNNNNSVSQGMSSMPWK